MDNWRTENRTKTYLEGVRRAIPLANEQVDILLRVIKNFKPNVNSFLDLGCGDGILGRALFSNYLNSKGIFLDFSEPMIDAAKLKCSSYKNQSVFIVQDFGNKNWIDSISDLLPLDLVVSGFSIHHQDNESKKRIYKDIFHKILKPGGLFLNLDQVASRPTEIEKLFDNYFLETVEKHHKKSDPNFSMENIKKEYHKDQQAGILALVEDQCIWLKEIGFVNVDCFFKVFELALFGGVKPV